MKRRDHLQPGYKAYNGYIFDQIDCNAYNAIQSRINSFIDHGHPVPETLLNASHHTFAIIIGVAQ